MRPLEGHGKASSVTSAPSQKASFSLTSVRARGVDRRREVGSLGNHARRRWFGGGLQVAEAIAFTPLELEGVYFVAT